LDVDDDRHALADYNGWFADRVTSP
jgi:hypothetical protein